MSKKTIKPETLALSPESEFQARKLAYGLGMSFHDYLNYAFKGHVKPEPFACKVAHAREQAMSASNEMLYQYICLFAMIKSEADAGSPEYSETSTILNVYTSELKSRHASSFATGDHCGV